MAGDLLDNENVDHLIASGYNRLLQTSHEGGIQLREYRAIYMADRVRNVSQVWMGATMGCAQCHDHKYDPFSTRDFYTMGAFFADIDDEDHVIREAIVDFNTLPTTRLPELEVYSAYQREQLAEIEAELASVDRAEDQARFDHLSKELESLRSAKSLTQIVKACEPRPVRVLPRGNWLDESGELVNPSFPQFLNDDELQHDARLTRLDLANWLTDVERGAGGLTARVMVNRLWYLMFGRGIAPVMDDFGGQGEPPEHPELLDNLSIEFVQSGWNVKHLMRLIALSSTYRQKSVSSPELDERDPFNTLLARHSRFRVPAEMVRDTALRVSGLLQDEIGGPSVKPYQPKGFYRHLNFPPREYEHHADQRQWRRGVYVHWQRQFLHPMLRAFDAPSREECTAERPKSNTSLAALTLLNDPTIVEAARSFAEDLLRVDGTVNEHLTRAFRKATSRSPTTEEMEELKKVYTESERYYSANPSAVTLALSTDQRDPDSGLDQVQLASWMNVARTILNLGETTNRG